MAAHLRPAQPEIVLTSPDLSARLEVASQFTPTHAVAGFITALTSAEPLLRGWGQHGWPFGVRHEQTRRTGTAVADAHQQRTKDIQARIRAARRRRPATVPSPA
ncbi:hypothetical protein KMT30_40555, partial [Streptomyces sp. IBSBF 2953]|nr:hypothetical protein [Streptomyces hayashii]